MYMLYCLDGSRATAAHMVLAEAGLPYDCLLYTSDAADE